MILKQGGKITFGMGKKAIGNYLEFGKASILGNVLQLPRSWTFEA